LPPDFPIGKAKVLSVRQMPFRKDDTAFDYDTWEKAAALAAADYQNDPELTAFSALDGEIGSQCGNKQSNHDCII
jgi:hypothetical protein